MIIQKYVGYHDNLEQLELRCWQLNAMDHLVIWTSSPILGWRL